MRKKKIMAAVVAGSVAFNMSLPAVALVQPSVSSSTSGMASSVTPNGLTEETADSVPSPEDTVPESTVDSSSAPSSSVPESVPAEQPPAEEDGSVTEALPGETAGSSEPAEGTAPDLTLQNAAPKAPPQNGWSEDGKSYFVEGQMLQSCEYLIDNVWYYFQADGTYATGAIRIADGRMMYYDAQGHLDYTHTGLERATDGKQYWLLGLGNCVTGEKMIDGAWRYFDPAAGGAMVQDAEVTLADGRLMRYDAEGRLVLGWYQTSYYLSTGKVRGTEILIDNAWYYFQANGTYATGAIRIPDGRMMYYDAHGKLDYTHTGIERAADGKQYWLLGAGNCLKGEKLIGGAWYYFDPAANGAMVQNSEVILTDGRLMRYDAEGRLVLGWHGKSYYLSTGKVRGTELKIENKWYYFDANGNYVTGLITFPDGSQKYYDANGVQVPIPTDEERLEVVNGKTYFKNWDGSYYIGEKMIAGAFRYFDPATGGAMVQDAEVTLADGRLMRYDAQGRLVLGWYGKSYYLSTGKVRGTEILIDNAWYYFQADGTYATGAIRIPDGRMMYYDAKGKLDYAHTGLERAADGKQYWLLGTGKCYKGEKLIDGSWHYFDPAANGAMVQGTEVVLTDGRLMRYDAEGRLVLGWYEKSYYLPTGKVRNTELAIEGKTYYFDASGNYVTGAVKLPDGKVNYYGAAGVLEPLYEGLQKANDGYYYYLMGRGAYVAHTEKLVEGSWRWFDEKGHMAINAAVKLPDGRVYFYNQDGCMVMDFVGLAIGQDGYYYYLKGNGTYAVSTSIQIDKVWYYFDANGRGTATSSHTTLTVTRGGKVVTDSSLEILTRVVAAEVGGFWNDEVYKAQAVASHSYILYQQQKGNNPAPQVPEPTSSVTTAQLDRIRAAIAPVADMIVTYQGSVAQTAYTASASIRTNSAADAGWGNFPYLTRVPSIYDQESANYSVRYLMTKDQMIAALNRIYDSDKTEPIDFTTDPATWLGCTLDERGYVDRMQITIRRATSAGVSGTYTPRANYFKENAGLGLRSANYTFSYHPDTQTWEFVTYGFGHGAGMSQWGAYFYNIKEGRSWTEILAHYFPGTTVSSL